MAPGTPYPPHGRGAALLLVPYDEVEEVFVDVGLPGEQGAAQLLAAMAEGAGEVEIFVAARGAEGAVSRGGQGFAWGRGAGTRGVHPAVGQTLCQRGGWMDVLPLCAFPRLGLGRGLRWGRERRAGSPRPHHHMPPCIPSHGGLPGGPCHVAGAE